jgi:hypothetical protein
MAASEMSPLVFRNTSLTMRQRFAPANACSTRTRSCPNFRLVRFSAAVSSRPGSFFFRLARFRPNRLVPLEAAILIQDSARRIDNALLIGNALVRGAARVCLAQEVDAVVGGGSDHDVLIAMGFFPATVVKCLVFRVLGPLASPFRSVDDERRSGMFRIHGLSEGLRITLRQGSQFREGIVEQGQESVQPIVHPRLTQAKEFGHDDLEGVGLEVDQQEQQLLGGRGQGACPARAGEALARASGRGLVKGIKTLAGLSEGRPEEVKLRRRQAGKGQAPTRIVSKFCVSKHNTAILLIRIKSIVFIHSMPTGNWAVEDEAKARTRPSHAWTS